MATTITKEFRFDGDNATSYATCDMNVVGRDSSFAFVYLNSSSYADVYLNQEGKNQIFPSSTATPYRLDHSMRYRRTIGGTGHFYFYIDGTELHHTSTTSNSYTTNDKTGITSFAVTSATSSSEFKWHIGNDRTTRGAELLWDKFIFYFYQYACSATSGTGISSASVDKSAPYSGDTVTFTCTVSDNYIFDGWYNGSTRVSTSTTYSVDAADLALTAKANIKTYSVSAIAGEGVSSASVSPTVVAHGSTATFTCTPLSGYDFSGWYNGSTLVSTSQTYVRTITSAISLTAKAVNYTNLYLKKNGSYKRIKAVYKKINGVYVKQTDISSILSTSEKYVDKT